MVKWPSVAVTSAHVRGQLKCAGLVWPAGLVPISLCSIQSVLKAIKGCCRWEGLHMMTRDKRVGKPTQSPQTKWLIGKKNKKKNPNTIPESLAPQIDCRISNLCFGAVNHLLAQPASKCCKLQFRGFQMYFPCRVQAGKCAPFPKHGEAGRPG